MFVILAVFTIYVYIENLAVQIFIHKLLAKYIATKFVYQSLCRASSTVVFFHYLAAHNAKTERRMNGAPNSRLPRGNRDDVRPETQRLVHQSCVKAAAHMAGTHKVLTADRSNYS